MKFKSKKEALASIVEIQRKVNGVKYPLFTVYLGTNLITKRKERIYSSSKARLIELIEEFYKNRAESGDLSSALPIECIVDAKLALRALADAGLSISLSECAKREIERNKAVVSYDKTIGDAYDDFMDYKHLNSELELKKTDSTTGNFVLKMGRNTKLITITTQSVLEYVKTYYGDSKPRTYNSHLSYIRTFLSWCSQKSQGFIPENPAAGIPLKPVEWEEPKFMSTEDCRKVIYAMWEQREAHPECLALTINGLMMGIRREESFRMANDPSAISVNLEDETVRIGKPKGYTKGIMPRAFKMTKMAVAWASSFPYHDAVRLITEQTSTTISAIAKRVGVDIPKNGFRHTFITKHIAAFGEPEKTQAIVGTSAQMRANNYCGLDSNKEGLEFFGIMPPIEHQ